MDYIYKSLDEGKFVIGIFIDLKKAFDTMKHDILLDKLEHYGIRRITLKWFKSYLEDRKQLLPLITQNQIHITSWILVYHKAQS